MKIDIENIVLSSGAQCACGCGNDAPIATRTNARLEQKKGEPLRYISGHNKRGTTDLSRYRVEQNGCWIWMGSKSRKGYGRAQIAGEHTGAHRAIYEAKFGELPRDVHLDHQCKNTSCVNPDHLMPKSPAENSADTCRTRLGFDVAAEIRSSKETCSSLARKLDVSRQAVSDARRGRTWAAAKQKLEPTVLELQASAHELFSRMIDA